LFPSERMMIGDWALGIGHPRPGARSEQEVQ
jgi:hypothetical protein